MTAGPVVRELPGGPNSREWQVSMPMSIPRWFLDLARQYGCVVEGAVVLPTDPDHALWRELRARGFA